MAQMLKQVMNDAGGEVKQMQDQMERERASSQKQIKELESHFISVNKAQASEIKMLQDELNNKQISARSAVTNTQQQVQELDQSTILLKQQNAYLSEKLARMETLNKELEMESSLRKMAEEHMQTILFVVLEPMSPSQTTVIAKRQFDPHPCTELPPRALRPAGVTASRRAFSITAPELCKDYPYVLQTENDTLYVPYREYRGSCPPLAVPRGDSYAHPGDVYIDFSKGRHALYGCTKTDSQGITWVKWRGPAPTDSTTKAHLKPPSVASVFKWTLIQYPDPCGFKRYLWCDGQNVSWCSEEDVKASRAKLLADLDPSAKSYIGGEWVIEKLLAYERGLSSQTNSKRALLAQSDSSQHAEGPSQKRVKTTTAENIQPTGLQSGSTKISVSTQAEDTTQKHDAQLDPPPNASSSTPAPRTRQVQVVGNPGLPSSSRDRQNHDIPKMFTDDNGTRRFWAMQEMYTKNLVALGQELRSIRETNVKLRTDLDHKLGALAVVPAPAVVPNPRLQDASTDCEGLLGAGDSVKNDIFQVKPPVERVPESGSADDDTSCALILLSLQGPTKGNLALSFRQAMKEALHESELARAKNEKLQAEINQERLATQKKIYDLEERLTRAKRQFVRDFESLKVDCMVEQHLHDEAEGELIRQSAEQEEKLRNIEILHMQEEETLTLELHVAVNRAVEAEEQWAAAQKQISDLEHGLSLGTYSNQSVNDRLSEKLEQAGTAHASQVEGLKTELQKEQNLRHEAEKKLQNLEGNLLKMTQLMHSMLPSGSQPEN
ncbi:hypothetical protein SERLADRAFT_413604 [Serpula lacrymans var. lacrymans S7.9]|nr:uncharacterized protein SERLADRAFT_413604 [Serpula lacrymans var. lacrymans S7.9]EGO27042.1 hypothetical protein SERLADRAFT_413604 [Serpula lacrymans var. lacrymans S7.9]